MKRNSSTTILLIVILGIIALGGMKACQVNNQLVTLDEACIAQWSQVENVYQRRADIVGQMIGTIKGETQFEQETLIKVIEARASATQIKVDPGNMTEEEFRKWEQAQNNLGTSLSRLLMVSENYPDLKANQGFQDLRVTIEGNENRITVERQKYIDLVKKYNTFGRRFPNNLFAGMFGFKRKPTFESKPGTDEAPVVDFSK